MISPDYLSTPSPLTKARANHDFKFLYITTLALIATSSLFPRTVSEWNTLPSYILANSCSK